jgi:putative ABC transport system permease protein
MAALPGVREASGVYPLPMAGEPWSGSFDVEGLPPETQEGPHAEYAVSLPGYFHLMGIPFVEGRDFAPTDNAKAPLVVIVDETLAHKYWPAESAIGKRINAGSPRGTWSTVIGVVKHVRTIGPQKESEPQLYHPVAQYSTPMLFPVARVSTRPASLNAAFRSAVHAIDHDVAVSRMRPLGDVVAGAIAQQRFNLFMISVFAAVALVLATVGLYGVMAYLVAQRTREIGIRIALGGQPAGVRLVVVRESLLIASAGVVVGIAITLILSGALGNLLYGIRSTDPVTYAFVATGLLVVSAAAAYLPARRATRIDPVLALRD